VLRAAIFFRSSGVSSGFVVVEVTVAFRACR
jgi:hypothetical protein